MIDDVHKMYIMMGDFNTKTGEQPDLDCGIGKYGLGTRNASGEQ